MALVTWKLLLFVMLASSRELAAFNSVTYANVNSGSGFSSANNIGNSFSGGNLGSTNNGGVFAGNVPVTGSHLFVPGSRDGNGGGSLELSIPGIPGQDYPVLNIIPDTGFSCNGRITGYYADTNQAVGCQVFHVCDERKRLYSFLCPNGTIFNQQYFVCDWWNNFQCASAEQYYHLNSLIGQIDGMISVNVGNTQISGGVNGILPNIVNNVEGTLSYDRNIRSHGNTDRNIGTGVSVIKNQLNPIINTRPNNNQVNYIGGSTNSVSRHLSNPVLNTRNNNQVQSTGGTGIQVTSRGVSNQGAVSNSLGNNNYERRTRTINNNDMNTNIAEVSGSVINFTGNTNGNRNTPTKSSGVSTSGKYGRNIQGNIKVSNIVKSTNSFVGPNGSNSNYHNLGTTSTGNVASPDGSTASTAGIQIKNLGNSVINRNTESLVSGSPSSVGHSNIQSGIGSGNYGSNVQTNSDGGSLIADSAASNTNPFTGNGRSDNKSTTIVDAVNSVSATGNDAKYSGEQKDISHMVDNTKVHDSSRHNPDDSGSVKNTGVNESSNTFISKPPVINNIGIANSYTSHSGSLSSADGTVGNISGNIHKPLNTDKVNNDQGNSFASSGVGIDTPSNNNGNSGNVNSYGNDRVASNTTNSGIINVGTIGVNTGWTPSANGNNVAASRSVTDTIGNTENIGATTGTTNDYKNNAIVTGKVVTGVTGNPGQVYATGNAQNNRNKGIIFYPGTNNYSNNIRTAPLNHGGNLNAGYMGGFPGNPHRYGSNARTIGGNSNNGIGNSYSSNVAVTGIVTGKIARTGNNGIIYGNYGGPPNVQRNHGRFSNPLPPNNYQSQSEWMPMG